MGTRKGRNQSPLKIFGYMISRLILFPTVVAQEATRTISTRFWVWLVDSVSNLSTVTATPSKHSLKFKG